ncbi:hypothetical protein [Vibrio sp. A2-1]|uniref:hypothetical protein n=1 Tax=Vibrio sp. A2-1 TaxID=2912252 RepID=UPI001F430334|nr:hypothetical protein [Vibrio sp. A2-1]MCF7486708.1 hypothetical protein [Vibrio sp. A2-1]
MSICISISEINWAITKDVFSIIGTIGALSIGFVGLFTWKRQLRGTSEYEVAKRAILKTYQLQEAIQLVRNPMLHLNKEEVEAGNQLQEEQRIYSERLNSLSEAWSELQVTRLEAKAIWSIDAHSSFDEIQKCVSKIKADIWLHFWLKGAYAGPGATVDNSPERVAKNNETVYYVSDEDPFSVQLLSAVKQVEEFFGTRVRGK